MGPPFVKTEGELPFSIHPIDRPLQCKPGRGAYMDFIDA